MIRLYNARQDGKEGSMPTLRTAIQLAFVCLMACLIGGALGAACLVFAAAAGWL
jgi:uncharacterized membrane protein YczE